MWRRAWWCAGTGRRKGEQLQVQTTTCREMECKMLGMLTRPPEGTSAWVTCSSGQGRGFLPQPDQQGRGNMAPKRPPVPGRVGSKQDTMFALGSTIERPSSVDITGEQARQAEWPSRQQPSRVER